MPEFLVAAEALLAVTSTADRPDQLRAALDLVVDVVGPGWTVERFESGGKPSALIYAGVERTARFRVILNAHLDVVPGEPEQFQPRYYDRRLYARGAQDMKLTALAQAYAFRESAATSPVPIALQLVTDEEVGGQNGTLYQLQQGVTADFVIIGEHSGLDIVADGKGILRATVHSTGRSGHGAYPWLGDNALARLVDTVQRIGQRYPTPGDAQWRTTVNLARIATTNQAYHQIPADAEAWLDIRFPGEDNDFAGRDADDIAAHLATFCSPGVSVTVGHLDPPHHVEHDSPDIERLRRAAQAQGYPAGFLYKHGAGDGRFYSRYGIPSVVYGIGGDGQHGPDEYADLDTVAPYHRSLLDFLADPGLAHPTGRVRA